LADAAYDEFAQQEITRLTELRAAVVEDSIEAGLALGRHAELTGEIEALVRAAPLRERLRAQLMVALYRSGRQADALRAYQEARAVLADELGLEPGPELRRLEAAILAQDPALEGRAAPIAALEMQPARTTNLPAPLTTLVGRTAELEAVADLVSRSRLVTLVGPGGAGKTRLATEVARGLASEFRHGAWLVELAGVGTEQALVPAIAGALDVPDTPRAAGRESPVDPLERVGQYLREKHTLVVLDNCEHLIAETA